MYYTKELVKAEVGDLADDLVDGVLGTLRKVMGKSFTEWARRYSRFDELADDAMSNAIMWLRKAETAPECFELDLQKLINVSVGDALKEHRQWLKLKDHRMREYPWDPTVAEKDGEDDHAYRGFTVFDEDQFVGQIIGTNHETADLPVDLSILTEEERDMLSLLGSGLSQKETALACGWHPGLKTDHRGFVQNRLRSIRRKLCDGASTQTEAVAWLRSQA